MAKVQRYLPLTSLLKTSMMRISEAIKPAIIPIYKRILPASKGNPTAVRSNVILKKPNINAIKSKEYTPSTGINKSFLIILILIKDKKILHYYR